MLFQRQFLTEGTCIVNPIQQPLLHNATKVKLGIVRKALRVGKNLEHFKAAAIALKSPLTKVTYVPSNASEEILRYLAVGRQLGYGGYLTLDIPTYVLPRSYSL